MPPPGLLFEYYMYEDASQRTHNDAPDSSQTRLQSFVKHAGNTACHVA